MMESCPLAKHTMDVLIFKINTIAPDKTIHTIVFKTMVATNVRIGIEGEATPYHNMPRGEGPYKGTPLLQQMITYL